MHVTMLGTGAPVPTLDRSGPAALLTVDDSTVLVDCGPGTMYQLIRNGVHPKAVDHLLFTHHHMDHNAGFFHFVIASWALGRRSLQIFGPDGTQELEEGLELLYGDDIRYRQDVGYPPEGIDDIEWGRISEGFTYRGPGWDVQAYPVKHSVETFALRFTEAESGRSVFFSGDTRTFPELSDFASDADVLVQDCTLGPVSEDIPDQGLVWEQYTDPANYRDKRERLMADHCTPEQAGEIAADAGVDTLVLTHLLPYRDTDEMRARSEERFAGTVIVAEDGLRIPVSG